VKGQGYDECDLHDGGSMNRFVIRYTVCIIN